jgi:hypothetical protein
MLGFFVNNIYAVFRDLRYSNDYVGISMDANCAPLMADLFSYSYESKFVQKLLWDTNKTLTRPSTIYTDISINDHNFHNYVHLIYLDLNELELKDTTESDISA